MLVSQTRLLRSQQRNSTSAKSGRFYARIKPKAAIALCLTLLNITCAAAKFLLV
ncbi:hypothetical protein GS682_17715 [Nostoc sp. B(2019)]|nr:hypothetical protein [Nostoc sp. B(2019)]